MISKGKMSNVSMQKCKNETLHHHKFFLKRLLGGINMTL